MPLVALGPLVASGDNIRVLFLLLNFFQDYKGDEDKEDKGDKAIAVVFTADFDKPNSGKVFASNFRERISKSDTGLPFVK